MSLAGGSGPGIRFGAIACMALTLCCAPMIWLSACDAISGADVNNTGALASNDPSQNTNTVNGDTTGDLFNPSGVAESASYKLAIAVDPVFCCNPLSVEFRADLGPDQSDDNAIFEWDFGDGRKGRGHSLRHTFSFAATYSVRLSARFSNGVVDSTTYQVTVGQHDPIASPDEPPSGEDSANPKDVDSLDPASTELKAVAGPDVEVFAGETVMLDGSRSKGSGVHDLRYRWIQISGPGVALDDEDASISSFVAPESEIDALVQLDFELIIAEVVSTASDTMTVRIVRRPEPLLIADAGAGVIVDGGAHVELDASRSVGTGSRPLTFSWVQIEGPAIALSSTTTVGAYFVAPNAINKPIYLTFELTVTQGLLVAVDEVEIVIAPVSTTPPPSDEQVLAWLSDLDPLQKVHYSWPMPTVSLASFDEDLLREYMRVSHAMSVWGEWVDEATLTRTMAIASQINDTAPEIPITLGLVFRPWERAFPPNVSPTYDGPEVQEEIDLFKNRLALIKGWVEDENAASIGAPVQVGAIILECERFVAKPADDPKYAEWNAAITAKHNVMYDAARATFPDARVEWYARGISDLFTLDERGDSYSVPLYHVPDRVAMRTLFRRTFDAATEHGMETVTPWIALGSGYIIQANGKKQWSFDYDYDLVYSWHIGAEVNDSWFGDRPQQFAPWNAAEIAIFWPAPWESRIPNWPRHFVAYVRGAHNDTNMPR